MSFNWTNDDGLNLTLKLSGYHKIISQWAHLFCKEEAHNLIGWKMFWLIIVTDFICREYHDFTSGSGTNLPGKAFILI